jgi:hypothetical protein
MKKIILFIAILFPILIFSKNIILLDYTPTSIDTDARESFVNLFIDNLTGTYDFNVVMKTDTTLPEYWGDKNEISNKYNNGKYSKALIFKYYYIEDRLIIRMTVLDFNHQKFVMNENFTISNAMELTYAAKCASAVLGENKSKDQLVEVGLLTSNEIQDRLKSRRNGLSSVAASCGYMWSAFTTDHLYAGNYKKVLLLNLSFLTETSKNTRISINFDLPVAAAISASIGYSYIFQPITNTPYLGFDFGAEYDYARKSLYPNNSIGGILLRPKAGFIFMNTYYTSVYIESGLRVVTTDFWDSGFELRAGIIFRNSGK